jgi:AraC-like DNA-binding protein
MANDTLSELLGTVRLHGAVFYYVNFGQHWAVDTPAAADIADAVMPGSEHVIEYHMMLKGTGWAQLPGQAPVRLDQGDIIVFPQGHAHVIGSAPGYTPRRDNADWVYTPPHVPQARPVAYHHGVFRPGMLGPAHEASAVMVCGFLGCDLRPFNPLVSALPKLLHVPQNLASSWIGRVIDQAALESADRRPGGNAVLQRLSEMMLVDTVRRYLESLPEDARGWLAGLRDRHLGRALALIHERPEHPWTVDGLGRAVGLSRSALHERFSQYLGMPPSQYLAHWRIQVGSRLLRETQRTVASIAHDVGYESEAAFSRAFRRLVGLPPAAWRRSQRELVAA